MSISDNLDDTIHYEVVSYVDERKFGDKITLPLDGRHRFQARTLAMQHAKELLVKMGLKINVDFKLELDPFNRYPTVRFSPEHEGAKTMLLLMWSKQ
jgi:hypothetical protein